MSLVLSIIAQGTIGMATWIMLSMHSDQGTIRSKEPMVDTMVDTMGLPTGRMVLIHIMGSMDHILNMQPSPSGKGEICDTEAIVNSHKGVGQ